jgi:hypothetical protein
MSSFFFIFFEKISGAPAKTGCQRTRLVLHYTYIPGSDGKFLGGTAILAVFFPKNT